METTCKSIMSFVFISLLVALLFILTVMTHEAQARGWGIGFGGEGNDVGYSVQQTNDGGYIVVGSTESYGFGKNDVYMIKIYFDGYKAWEKTFGGEGNDVGYSVQQTNDRGYIVVGSTESYGAGGSDVYLIKTDAYGNIEWQRMFGGRGRDEGYSVQQTTDGGYIIAGSRDGDVYLIKTNELGNKEWDKTFGRFGNDEGYSVQQTTDGGYITAGHRGDDIYLVKTDALGNTEWQETFGGKDIDIGHSTQQTNEGGYIVAGSTGSYGVGLVGSYDVYLIKTDASGNIVWQKTFGGEYDDEGYFIHQTSDGGFVIVGDTNSYGAGRSDIYLLKTDTQGNKKWEKTFGGESDDHGYSVQQTTDGGYIITGSCCGDVCLIKTDANGND